MIKYSFQEVSFFVREAKGKRIPEPALGNGEQTVDELPGYGKLNQPTPIASEGWNQVSNSRPAMEDFTAEDWTLLSQKKKISTLITRWNKSLICSEARKMLGVSNIRSTTTSIAFSLQRWPCAMVVMKNWWSAPFCMMLDF